MLRVQFKRLTEALDSHLEIACVPSRHIREPKRVKRLRIPGIAGKGILELRVRGGEALGPEQFLARRQVPRTTGLRRSSAIDECQGHAKKAHHYWQAEGHRGSSHWRLLYVQKRNCTPTAKHPGPILIWIFGGSLPCPYDENWFDFLPNYQWVWDLAQERHRTQAEPGRLSGVDALTAKGRFHPDICWSAHASALPES